MAINFPTPASNGEIFTDITSGATFVYNTVPGVWNKIAIGYTGSTGVGYTGSKGDTGFVGSIGSLGYTGSTGAGFTGSTGFVGSIGATGATGNTGAVDFGTVYAIKYISF